MQKILDDFQSTNDWITDGSITFLVNEVEQFISNNNSKSLLINISAGSNGKFFEKTTYTATDLSSFAGGEMVLQASSSIGGSWLNDMSGFKYKIDFGFGEYFLPISKTLDDVIIQIPDSVTFDKVRITVLHDNADLLVLSFLGSSSSEIPLDIFNSIKTELQNKINTDLVPDLNIGTLASGVIGDSQIQLTGSLDYINQDGYVLLDDGIKNEIVYILEDAGNGIFNLGGSKPKLVNSYTNASVSIYPLVEIGTDEDSVSLPGVTLWGLTPEPIKRGSKLELITDSYKVSDGTARQKKEGQILVFDIIIDIDAKESQVDIYARLSTIIRSFIAREFLWVAGKKFDIDFAGAPVEVEPSEAFGLIRKMQYTLQIEIKEDIWATKSIIAATGTATATVNPVAQ